MQTPVYCLCVWKVPVRTLARTILLFTCLELSKFLRSNPLSLVIGLDRIAIMNAPDISLIKTRKHEGDPDDPYLVISLFSRGENEGVFAIIVFLKNSIPESKHSS